MVKYNIVYSIKMKTCFKSFANSKRALKLLQIPKHLTTSSLLSTSKPLARAFDWWAVVPTCQSSGVMWLTGGQPHPPFQSDLRNWSFKDCYIHLSTLNCHIPCQIIGPSGSVFYILTGSSSLSLQKMPGLNMEPSAYEVCVVLLSSDLSCIFCM